MLFRKVIAVCAVFVAGCRSPEPPPLAVGAPAARFDAPRDDLNRPVALQKPATRVIAIGPGAVETLYALGAASKLVGRDDYADFPSAARQIAVAGSFQGPNVEQCVALRPDLVVVQGETWDAARVEAWQNQIGVPVAALTPTSLMVLRGDIRKLAVWTGSKRADVVNAELNGRAPLRRRRFHRVRPRQTSPSQARKYRTTAYRARARRVSTSATRVNRTRVRRARAFVEIGRSPLFTAGASTLVDDVLRAGGFENAAKVRGYQAFGTESLVASQPDVYIVPSGGSRAEALRQLRAHPALSKLSCVQAGRIVVIDGDLLLRPGPRLAQGIAVLRREARGVHVP